MEAILWEHHDDATQLANLAMLKSLDPVAFNKFDFKFDTILQRLPEGMKAGDTLESHKEKCVQEMTETHQFESMELAEKFIKNRFPDFQLVEEDTPDGKLYVCPHGEDEPCVAYVKLFLGLGVIIVRACFGHYGHDIKIGQYRFTGIQFAAIRLFSDFYWRHGGPEWNVHNIVYCFKHWYDDTHALHYLSIYDLKAIAEEIGKPDAASVLLPNGVYHAVAMTTSLDAKLPTANRTASSNLPKWNSTNNLENGNSNGEGTSSLPPPPQLSIEPCKERIEALTDWFGQGPNAPNVINTWSTIHGHATELKNIAFLKMLTPSCTEIAFNDAQQIFEMLSQAADLAFKMNQREEAGETNMEVPTLIPPTPFNGYMFPFDSNGIDLPLGTPFGTPVDPNRFNPAIISDPANLRLTQSLAAALSQPGDMERFPHLFNTKKYFTTPEKDDEGDFTMYEKVRKEKSNIWNMPLPKRDFIPSRLRYATGIPIKEKLKEMRSAEESEAIAEELRLLTLRELAIEDPNLDPSILEAQLECETETETESKNKKKKNKKKKNKKNKNKANETAQQPLRHRDP